jgi:tRNA G18 (ribose-2'-O)-methylase SpoU
MTRGYFGIGIYHPKRDSNVGTLMRSAQNFGAAFVFTIGRRYREQASDTTKTWKNVPLFHYNNLDDLNNSGPKSCPLIGVELTESAQSLHRYAHPDRAMYLMGAEDHGLPPAAIKACYDLVQIVGPAHCLNVSVAGSIVMYDRFVKRAA